MNFLEAHKIVHDYAGSIGTGADASALLYRPKSNLKNAVREIVDAHKIFYGHMIFFKTRTQEEYSQMHALLYFLPCFVENDVYDEVVNCNKILEDKSIISRWRYKNIRPYIEKKAKEYIFEMTNEMTQFAYSEEVESFFSEALSYCTAVQKQMHSENWSENSYFDYTSMVCEYLYKIAKVNYEQGYEYFFLDFETLRKLSSNTEHKSIYYGYLDYIKLHR